MSSCRECVHHLVCAVYAPNFDDILARGDSCSEFKSESDFIKGINRDIDKKTDKGYLYIKTENPYVNGIVGTDIKLTLRQKIEILFSKGISVVLFGKLK